MDLAKSPAAKMQKPRRALVGGLSRPSNYPVGSTPEWGPVLGPYGTARTGKRKGKRAAESNVKRNKKNKKKEQKKKKSIWRSWRWRGRREENSLISLVVSHRHTDRPRSALQRGLGCTGASLHFVFVVLSLAATKGRVSFNYRKSNERAERREEAPVLCKRERERAAIIVEIAENPPDKRVHEASARVKRRPQTGAANREISTDRVTTRRYFRAFSCSHLP